MVVEMLNRHMSVQAYRRHKSGKQHVELRAAMHQLVRRTDCRRASESDAHGKRGKLRAA